MDDLADPLVDAAAFLPADVLPGLQYDVRFFESTGADRFQQVLGVALVVDRVLFLQLEEREPGCGLLLVEDLQLFEDLLVVTYADRFEKYSGEKLVVKEAEIRGKRDALVRTTMVRVDGSKVLKVDWRVRRKDGKYKIVDIMVEGISMIQTQKSEFSSFIKKNGGTLDPLLTEIQKRIDANP